jgi:hypothetical protein
MLRIYLSRMGKAILTDNIEISRNGFRGDWSAGDGNSIALPRGADFWGLRCQLASLGLCATAPWS